MTNVKNDRFYYGWLVVAVAALTLIGNFPVVVLSFSVFAKAYVKEFHASRGAISVAFAAHNFAGAAFAFLCGRLADRFGIRKLMLPSIAIVATILLSALFIGSRLWQLYVFYMMVGAASQGSGTAVCCLVACRWFNRRRGLALGLIMAGLGVGSILAPPLVQQLIANVGWRKTLALFGLLMLAVVLPIVSKVIRNDPREIGLLPDGYEIEAGHDRDLLDGFTWGETWRSRTFWLIIVAFFLIAMGVHGCTVHIAQIVSDHGATATTAALITSVAGLALMLGRVGVGYLLDRYFAPTVARLIFACAASGMVLLGITGDGFHLVAGGFLVALAFGAEVDLMSYLISRYFGLRSLGSGVCFAFSAFLVAGGVGPVVMGYGFNLTGSYSVPLAGFVAAALIAVLLLGRLGNYKFVPTLALKAEEVAQ